MHLKPFPDVENISAITIPFPVVPNLITSNVYAVGEGPVTLIDIGLKLPGALEIVQKKLRLAGFEINDIERIIITHGHLDHFGLANQIRKVATHPVECFIHMEDKWRVSRENLRIKVLKEKVEKLRAMVGMPQKEMEGAKKRFSLFKELFDPLDEVSIMEDGTEFVGNGYHLEVIHTPGHTPGTCCVYESQQKILFSGDHIIKHVTPNPLMIIDRDHLSDPNYKSLKSYFDSLSKLTKVDARFVFPGHGEHIDDLSGIISSYVAHHQHRMDLVWNAINKKTRPIYDLIDDVFPNVPEDDTLLAISEILVHLEMLIDEGRAELYDAGPPSLFCAL